MLMSPQTQKNDVCVIMCVWKRIERLENTLKMMSCQKYKEFDFYIWNNNADEKIVEFLEKMKISHSDILKGVKNSEKNVGGIGRFIYAKELKDVYSKVIFIDDDQLFQDDLIEEMVSLYQEKSIISWWAWTFRGDYLKSNRVTNLNSAEYCGTGGMIVDSKIFENEIVFQIPSKYKFIEDLWLSHVAKKHLGYKLLGYQFKISDVQDGKNQCFGLVDLKREMYRELFV